MITQSYDLFLAMYIHMCQCVFVSPTQHQVSDSHTFWNSEQLDIWHCHKRSLPLGEAKIIFLEYSMFFSSTSKIHGFSNTMNEKEYPIFVIF